MQELQRVLGSMKIDWMRRAFLAWRNYVVLNKERGAQWLVSRYIHTAVITYVARSWFR